MKTVLFSMGLGAYTLQQAKGLAQTGHEVLSVIPKHELTELAQHCPRFMAALGGEVFGYGGTRVRFPQRAIAMIRMLLRVIASRPDVVHITLAAPVMETLLIASLGNVLRVPVVTTLHDVRFHPGDLFGKRHFQITCSSVARSNLIIVHGEGLRKDAQSLFVIPQEKIRVVPHGNYCIYTEATHQCAGPNLFHQEILFFGRMKKYKGLDVLIEAAKLLEKMHPNARIIIAGQGPELDRLESACRERPNMVVKKGYVSIPDMARLFSSCSAVVLPYREASQSGPLLTAFSFGRPVVASSVGEIPSLLRHEREGLLVEPGDPHALAMALSKMLSRPAEAEEMGKKGMHMATGQLEWGTALSYKFLQAYEQVKHQKKFGRRVGDCRSAERKKLLDDYYRDQVAACDGVSEVVVDGHAG